MKLSNIFKKKKKRKEEEKEKPKAPEAPKKPQVIETTKKREVRKKIIASPNVLRSVHVTEKATDFAGKNQYVFKVFPGAGKQKIKKTVEAIYGIDVLRVRTIKVPKKQRRLGRNVGWRKAYKKAIITLKKGQKIEVLPR